jgi:tetratricopeptide (TPR) repeat protein
VALQHYEQALEQVTADPDSFLAVLLARDAVRTARREHSARAVRHIRQWTALDERLRQLSPDLPANLPLWRKTLQPPESSWWWFLDQAAQAKQEQIEQKEEEKDILWALVAGTLILFTTTLTLEIIKRLWTGTPDSVATFGTLLTLLLTASPFSKQGQAVAQKLFKRVHFRYRAEVMAATASIAFGLVLLIWFLGLPALAVYYSNRGFNELGAGEVTEAQRHFQRAVALDPEQVVAYQHVADVYARIGQPEEAIDWYKQAIHRNLNFGPAYARLSQTYNEQGQFEAAIQTALAGLRPENQIRQADIALAARYNLLANLGWAYFGQEEYDRAQETLEAALVLEPQLKQLEATHGQLRRALPHYYLAQVYDHQGNAEGALVQWRESLRYLDADNWDHRAWLATVQQNLSNSESQ